MKESSSCFVKKTEIGGRELQFKLDFLAPQSDGSVLATYGQTTVLATCVMAKERKEGIDFLPLVVDYEEKLYAAGKISSSRFIKREGRPSEEAILTGRLIDRAVRPLFPKNFYNDVQVIITVLSVDSENDPDIVALWAASAALSASKIPFEGPLGAVRVGRVDGEWILNPTYNTRAKSDLDLIVVGKDSQIIMLEGGGKEIKEEDLFSAIQFAQKHLKKTIEIQKEIVKKRGRGKVKIEIEKINKKIEDFIKKNYTSKIKDLLSEDKLKREKLFLDFKKELEAKIEKEFKESEEIDSLKRQAFSFFNELVRKYIRENILENKKRPDGRTLDEIRPITVDVSLFPRTHGSGYFKRGYTEVLAIATLGSTSAEQILDGLEPETKKRFMHHYNFPPFSVGEIGKLFTSRREIGHGALAERALLPLIPLKEEFPYTIRLVSEVLSSDGSTSMASVCASSLALMDAGIPILRPVAGVSIGLVKEGKKWETLTDISGIEDNNGDMDFKVAGTQNGVTAIQMDLKLPGIELEIIKKALLKAKEFRYKILEKIIKILPAPRGSISPFAPKIISLKVNPAKIRDIIGPSGKTINKIISETQSEIDVEPDGTVYITAPTFELAEKAKKTITALTKEFVAGDVIEVEVKKIADFGAFAELTPGTLGLIHISQLAPYHVKNVEDVVKVGDKILAKIINIGENGRISLSLKEVFEEDIQKERKQGKRGNN